MIKQLQYVQFLGCDPSQSLRLVTCAGVDSSLIHQPVGSIAYNLVDRDLFVSSDGTQNLADESRSSTGPFILPSPREAYFRFLLGEDYSKSRFARD